MSLQIRSNEDVYKSLPWFWQKNQGSSKKNAIKELDKIVYSSLENDYSQNHIFKNTQLFNNSELILGSIRYIQCFMNKEDFSQFEITEKTQIESFLCSRKDIKSHIEIICCQRQIKFFSFFYKNNFYTKSAGKFSKLLENKIKYFENKQKLEVNKDNPFFKKEISELLKLCSKNNDYKNLNSIEHYDYLNRYYNNSNFIFENVMRFIEKINAGNLKNIKGNYNIFLSGKEKIIYDKICEKLDKMERNKSVIENVLKYKTYFETNTKICYNDVPYKNDELSFFFLYEEFLSAEDEIKRQFFMHNISQFIADKSQEEIDNILNFLATKIKSQEDKNQILESIKFKTYFDHNCVFYKEKNYDKNELSITFLYEKFFKCPDEVKKQFFLHRISKFLENKSYEEKNKLINLLSYNLNFENKFDLNRCFIAQELESYIQFYMDNDKLNALETNSDINSGTSSDINSDLSLDSNSDSSLDQNLNNSELMIQAIKYIQCKMNNIKLDFDHKEEVKRFLKQRNDIKLKLEIICAHKWKMRFNSKKNDYTKQANNIINKFKNNFENRVNFAFEGSLLEI